MDGARISSQSQRLLLFGLTAWIGLGVIPVLTAAQEPPVCQCTDRVFLQDVTGSMSSLNHVRNELGQVLDLTETEVGSGLRAGVISFGDTIVVNQQLTPNLALVRAAIAGMAAQDGNGEPEPSDEALREALTESVCEPCGQQNDLVIGDFDASYRRNCRKIAVLVTDNPPAGCDDVFTPDEDAPNAHLRALEALAKEVQIAAVLVGSGTGTVEDIMRDYAETTGGIFVRVDAGVPEISDALASFIAECADCNLDNTVDPVDLAKGVPDCDDNDVPDVCQQDVFCTSGFPTACQPPTDCNSNSTPDLCEIRDGSPDCDLNGVIDSCEPDCNGNSLPDECDLDSGTSQDCDANGVPDECDINEGTSKDCNENGVPDKCDISNGGSLDTDCDGIPDECQVIHVDVTAPGPEHNGLSWQTAYLALQDALDRAIALGAGVSCSVLVAQGTYYPDTTNLIDARDATFLLRNNTTISGGFGGCGEPDPNLRHLRDYPTVLSGNIGTPNNTADNCYHVVTGDGADTTAVLDGLIITSGNANGTGSNAWGGGMTCNAGSPTVHQCRFIANYAIYGGGLGVQDYSSYPELVNCVFSGNAAVDGAGVCTATGGRGQAEHRQLHFQPRLSQPLGRRHLLRGRHDRYTQEHNRVGQYRLNGFWAGGGDRAGRRSR